MTTNENRLNQLFLKKNKEVLAVYFTAGFPELNDTLKICQALQEAGVDIIEIGMPFSDPLADGPTIQASNQRALANGMALKTLFSQLSSLRSSITIPVVLMGYLNPVIQFGFEEFLKQCSQTGIDGLILPDLPLKEFQAEYKLLFKEYQVNPIFLVTPDTSEERLRLIDSCSRGFVYAVSNTAVTGGVLQIDQQRREYFQRLQRANLVNPILVGFGISDRDSFNAACKYVNGAIVGSAFIRVLQESSDIEGDIARFVKQITGGCEAASC